jgi:hypothetical protein
MQTQPTFAHRLHTRRWTLLALAAGLILLAAVAFVVSGTAQPGDSAQRALPQAVTAADLLLLKEARAEALEPVVARALPQAVTAADLLLLKEARAEER